MLERFSPEFRERHIEAPRVERVVAWARERHVVRLVVWITSTNEPVLALYRRCGFNLTGNSKPHMRNPLVDCEMAQDLR